MHIFNTYAGFFIGLTCGMFLCLVITLIIIWMYKRFKKRKSNNVSTTGDAEEIQ